MLLPPTRINISTCWNISSHHKGCLYPKYLVIWKQTARFITLKIIQYHRQHWIRYNMIISFYLLFIHPPPFFIHQSIIPTSMYISLFIHIFHFIGRILIHPFTSLLPSISPSIHFSFHLSIFPSFSPFYHPFINISIPQSIHLSFHTVYPCIIDQSIPQFVNIHVFILQSIFVSSDHTSILQYNHPSIHSFIS